MNIFTIPFLKQNNFSPKFQPDLSFFLSRPPRSYNERILDLKTQCTLSGLLFCLGFNKLGSILSLFLNCFFFVNALHNLMELNNNFLLLVHFKEVEFLIELNPLDKYIYINISETLRRLYEHKRRPFIFERLFVNGSGGLRRFSRMYYFVCTPQQREQNAFLQTFNTSRSFNCSITRPISKSSGGLLAYTMNIH